MKFTFNFFVVGVSRFLEIKLTSTFWIFKIILEYQFKIKYISLTSLYFNCNNKINKTKNHPRHGTQCVVQYPTNRSPAQSLQENAITVFRPRLYNSLPKYLRDIERVKTERFEFELDKFLDIIPDQPKMPNYVTASGSNSILDQLTHNNVTTVIM